MYCSHAKKFFCVSDGSVSYVNELDHNAVSGILLIFILIY